MSDHDHHIGDIIDALVASRFAHPDVLRAEIEEATEYVRVLDEQQDGLVEGLRLIADDPDLDDLEAHAEMQFQGQIIAAVAARRDAEQGRADRARERLQRPSHEATDRALG